MSDVARELIRLGLAARGETPEARWRKRGRILERAAQLRAAMRRRRRGRPVAIDPDALLKSVREERNANLIAGTIQ